MHDLAGVLARALKSGCITCEVRDQMSKLLAPDLASIAVRLPGDEIRLASLGNLIEEGYPKLALLPGNPVAALAPARGRAGTQDITDSSVAVVAGALAPMAQDLQACVYVSTPPDAASPLTFIFLGWRHGLDPPTLSRAEALLGNLAGHMAPLLPKIASQLIESCEAFLDTFLGPEPAIPRCRATQCRASRIPLPVVIHVSCGELPVVIHESCGESPVVIRESCGELPAEVPTPEDKMAVGTGQLSG